MPATGEAAVKTAVEHFGRLDVLFNNAGIFDLKPILEVTEAEFDRFLGIILKSKLFVAQAAAKAMKASGRGGRSSDQLHVGTERRFLRLTTPEPISVLPVVPTPAHRMENFQWSHAFKRNYSHPCKLGRLR